MIEVFGFQLIAFFNQRFSELAPDDQEQHLLAVIATACAAALTMAPAAWHRQMCPRAVTTAFLKRSSRLLMASMIMLMIGLSTDIQLVSGMVLRGSIAWTLTLVLAVFYSLFWFLLPWAQRARRTSNSPRS